ncbi:MAG TPA: DUF6496 domain-containing protein [Phycisphaerales bacterium]|nr:DUF6496 domain-containing protein [Phycisphaerales bacterium]
MAPSRHATRRAQRDKRKGKSASTQAGEFVREEIKKIRKGRHGARSAKQAIAIGLNEARRAGVDLPPPKKGKASTRTRRSAKYSHDVGQGKRRAKRRPNVSRAVTRTLKREGGQAASPRALSAHARKAASQRTHAERSASARKAAASRTHAERSASARKAARTRARNS